ncbi:acyl-CoA thioesterase [Nocardioides eburneiflavus]|uniref:Acyl-CoA thioesterase n=1 Tax=Nocardioides eburneiflavus TaxID=2518372 RepID=A0A4Z1CML1_9ACTN|nr:acyl-CoA thioesterase [Nocardioides eburneiflavus]TGN65049.1 acyl-CoA thioesterase [Nocardioides eburneiflavus]
MSSATEPLPSFDVPEGYASWWSLELRPWFRDIDYLGHLTASSYAVIYEEAVGTFVEAMWGTDAAYVVAHVAITYGREVRMGESPVRVHVRCEGAEGSRFSCAMVLIGPDGSPRSTARGYYSAWDMQARRSRELLNDERERLLRGR